MHKNKFSHDLMQFLWNPKTVLVCLTFLSSQVLSQPLASGHSKFLGNVIGGSIPSDFDYYWNQVTPENSGKWGSVEIGQDVYQWGGLNAAYNYALDHDFTYKHHVLVWGQQEPWWVSYLDSLEQAQEVEEWIQLVGESYPEMDYIDVVNEPLTFHNAQPSYKEALGGDGQTGWDWVIWSFEKARQYCSENTKLVLNEYNILNSNYYTNQTIEIVNLLKERGLIDVIGVQGHHFEFRHANVSTLKNNLDKLAATGLPIHISEFDIDVADDDGQLQEYQRLFPVLWEHSGVVGITLWGYIQYRIWKTNAYLVRANGSERPALQWLRTYLSETDVDGSAELLPTDYVLSQNFPNPFNASTMIRYTLNEPSNVQMTVYNTMGVKVRTLVNDYESRGSYSVLWDGTDDQNQLVSSGIYLVSLETDNKHLQKKMLCIK